MEADSCSHHIPPRNSEETKTSEFNPGFAGFSEDIVIKVGE